MRSKILRFFSIPGGLWIKSKREMRAFQLINMGIRGQLRDNPAVNILRTVIGEILAAVIMKLLGILN